MAAYASAQSHRVVQCKKCVPLLSEAERKRKEEGRSFSFIAFYPDSAALAANDFGRDEQTQAKPWRTALRRVLDAIERREDLFLLLPGDPRTKILHAKGDFPLIHLGPHDDFPSVRRIFDCVG